MADQTLKIYVVTSKLDLKYDDISLEEYTTKLSTSLTNIMENVMVSIEPFKSLPHCSPAFQVLFLI